MATENADRGFVFIADDAGGPPDIGVMSLACRVVPPALSPSVR
jgi:hypothetical protein